MKIINQIAVLSLLTALTACGQAEPKETTPDLSFLKDIELAVTAPTEGMTLSPLELEKQAAAEAKKIEAAAPVQRTATRSSSSSARTASAPAAPRARVETVDHTVRDAAIGAGAGAVIGAVAGGPRKRVQGAAIGAVVGGVVGGVVGNTVDKSTRVVYD